MAHDHGVHRDRTTHENGQREKQGGAAPRKVPVRDPSWHQISQPAADGQYHQRTDHLTRGESRHGVRQEDQQVQDGDQADRWQPKPGSARIGNNLRHGDRCGRKRTTGLIGQLVAEQPHLLGRGCGARTVQMIGLDPGRELMTQLLGAKGWQMSVHANGDVAVDIVLDAFSRALQEHGLHGTDHRWRVEHIGGARADHFPRMAQIGVVPSLGPFQFSYWGDLLDGKMFAPEVGSQWQRARDAFDAGLKVSFHNDGSVSPPWPLRSAQSMVTRRTASGQLHGANQAISVDEAMRAITINAAYSVHHEDQVGSIEVGKLADFVLLGADPYAVPIDEIEKIKVLSTWVGGSPIDMDEFSSAGGDLTSTAVDQMIALGVPLCQHHDHG